MLKTNRSSWLTTGLIPMTALAMLLNTGSLAGQQPETQSDTVAVQAGQKPVAQAGEAGAAPASTSNALPQPAAAGAQAPPKPAIQAPVVPQMATKHAAPAAPQPTVVLKPGEVPQIEFDTPIYDFGKIRAGIEVVHDFWFTNTGTGPLEILKVQPSCGCTTAGAYDSIVQPGQMGKIPLKMTPGQTAAPVAKNITITTNAPASSNVSLTLKGEVWVLVQVAPMAINFPNILTTEASTATPTMTAAITVNNGAKASIQEAKSNNPAFKAEIKELEPGTKYNLIVTAVPPLKEGSNSGMIEIMTGLTEMPRVNVSVMANVQPEVVITPNQLAYVSTSKVAQKRNLSVRNNGKTAMKVSNLTSSNPGVGVEFKEIQPGILWTLIVDLPADYAKVGTEPDVISFNTDRPGFELVKLPLIEQQSAMPIRTAVNNPAAGVTGPAVYGPQPAAGVASPNAMVRPAAPVQPATDPHAGHGH